MLKLLHTADWQIGKLFGQFDADDAALLADARFGTVERLAALATAEGVDLVLVAGDVFDAQGVLDKTIHRLFNAMAGFAGPWVLIPGNHDAGLAESVWTRAARLNAIPPNIHVCLQPEALPFPALGATVLPAPLTQRHTHADLTAWFDTAPTDPAHFRIGVAHGSVQGLLAEGIDSSNPIAPDRAARARLDYLALGDWHGTRAVDERTWYSGTHETDRFRNNESGQALRVDIAAPGAVPTVTPVSSGQYRWRDESAELHVPSDVDALLARLAAWQASDVVQLALSGRTDLAGHRRLNEAIGQAQGRVRSLAADLSALRLDPTEDDLDALAADGYLGEVLAALRSPPDGVPPDVARDALALLAGLLDERRGRAGDAR